MNSKLTLCNFVANKACEALINEVSLTPKPGLVDQIDSGSHDDLSIELMKKSADSLKDTFYNIAFISFGQKPSQRLREEIATIGRHGEERMYEATNGINTHKGAIWALGLLTSAFAIGKGKYSIKRIIRTAGQIARFPDEQFYSKKATNGMRVIQKYNVQGARGEAENDFPHLRDYAIPTYEKFLSLNHKKQDIYLFTLLSLIANLDDTCILHRGGLAALNKAQEEAKITLESQDLSRLKPMNELFIAMNISPGGSADLLAATILLYDCNQLRQELARQGNLINI